MDIRKIRTYLFAGLIVLLPVWLTLFTIVWLFNYVDGIVANPLKAWLGVYLPGLGLLLVLILLIMAGWLTTHLLGQQLINFGERTILRIPMVKAIYSAVKQVTEAVLSPREQAFSRVVLVEYPRLGVFSMGFAAGEVPGTNLIRVWIPPGPSPTAGPIVMFPVDQVASLPMSVEDGLKFIVSAGALLPKDADVAAIAEASAELMRRRLMQTTA